MSGQFPISPTLQQFYAALVAFITTVTGLPAAQVVQGLGNRVSEPEPGFIVFQAITRHRLRTNIDIWDETDDDPSTMILEEGVELRVQIDCYSPQGVYTVGAEDWASILSATLRDEYGCSQFPANMQPLHADDATMMPAVYGEEQYEERWMLEAYFQINPQTTIPAQYADALKLQMVSVTKVWPT